MLTQVFTVEPLRGMHQKTGELGEIELQLLFVPSTAQVAEDLPLESPPLEAMLEYAKEKAIPADLLTMMREAAVILVGRTITELKATAGDDEDLGEEAFDFLTTLQVEALAEDPAADTSYDLDEDLKSTGMKKRPMRAKYATAVAFCLSKFFGLNPAVLTVVGNTLTKFSPAASTTGNYAAAVLGSLGMPEIALGGIQSYLKDRLNEEMLRLLNVGRGKKRWYKALQDICRGRGCAPEGVDIATEVVAFADSFSTAAALGRLVRGSGAAEVDEIVEVC